MPLDSHDMEGFEGKVKFPIVEISSPMIAVRLISVVPCMKITEVQGTNRKGWHLNMDCNVILFDYYNHCSFVMRFVGLSSYDLMIFDTYLKY